MNGTNYFRKKSDSLKIWKLVEVTRNPAHVNPDWMLTEVTKTFKKVWKGTESLITYSKIESQVENNLLERSFHWTFCHDVKGLLL